VTRLIKQEFQCPVCRAAFQGQVVESVSHQGQDSDFFPHYLGPDPLPFFLVQCVQCQYCAYPEDFTEESETAKLPTPKQIREILETPLAKKMDPEARRYFLAGRLYELGHKNPYHIGNLYLRGSWCCRIVGDRKGEVEMQQLAVRFLRLSAEQSTMTNPENLPVVIYLVGELYRRLDEKNQAREWFGNVEEAILDAEQQWLVELAKKQAELNEHFIN